MDDKHARVALFSHVLESFAQRPLRQMKDFGRLIRVSMKVDVLRADGPREVKLEWGC